MKKAFFLFLAWSIFSCASNSQKEVIQGKLEDFVSSEVSFERDLETGFMRFYQAVEYQGKEAVYTFSNGLFQYFDPSTGRKIGAFQIPKEGPLSVKGGIFEAAALPENQIVAYNELGNANFYRDGTIEKSIQLPMEDIGIEKQVYLRNQKNTLLQVSPNSFELSNDPFDMMSSRNNTPGFDINFGAWLARFDDQGNWICISNFKAPYDESYVNSANSGALVRMIDPKDKATWLQFPYSDSLYVVKDCQIQERFRLESKSALLFKPEERIKSGGNTTWKREEDGALNLHLLQDPKTGLAVRLVLQKEKDLLPDEADVRKKLFEKETSYLLLIYSSDWQLLGELELVYPKDTRFENMFATSQGIFINKPEQKSEDEYEFMKLDLSQFSD